MQVNPMSPYFLIYMHNDGTARFTFARPKETMLLMRDLAANEPNAFERLCEMFDQRTNDGADMSHYDQMLAKALQSIEHTFQRRAATGLMSGRDSVLPTATETPTSDSHEFDLVTWLVILDGSSN